MGRNRVKDEPKNEPKNEPKTSIQDFDLYKWQNFPLTVLHDGKTIDHYAMKLSKIANGLPSRACVLTFLRVYDSHFVVYAYKSDGVEYAFAWETFDDEMHRAYSGKSKLKFYDKLVQNYNFNVEVNPENPREHFILDTDLQPMNEHVILLDPALVRK
jgi:hypothetical protein